jgi:hypothetical protein
MSLDTRLPEQTDLPTPEILKRPALETPEIPLSQDLRNVLYHPDEVVVSLDRAETTAVQEQIIENRRADAKIASQLEKALAAPNVDLQALEIERLRLHKEVLQIKLAALETEEAKQSIRIEHLKDGRKALLEYATGSSEALEAALKDPVIYMKKALRGLGKQYVDRSITREDPVTGIKTQRFGLLTPEQPPREVNGHIVPTSRRVDIDVELIFAPGEDEVSGFRIMTDLQGKLDHPQSLSFEPASPKDEETGQRQIQVRKHGWKNGGPKVVEVTDDINKLVFFQAVVTDLYHGVSGYRKTDDALARERTQRQYLRRA